MARTIYTLLVGIDNYPPSVNPLRGCVNDIRRVETLLKERIGRDEPLEQRILTDDKATWQGIVDGFRQHLVKAKAGDVARVVLPDGLGWCNGAGNVLGVYLHGLFEDPAVLQALFGAQVPTLDAVLDGLADYVEQHFGADTLLQLLEPKQAA